MTRMNSLPPTLFQHVALYLEPKDLVTLGSSSKSQYKQMTDQELWKRYTTSCMSIKHKLTFKN